jgi:universal stress protein E
MKNLLVIADKPGGKNTALIRAINLQQQLGGKIILLGFSYVNIKNIDDPELAKLSRNQLEKKILKRRKEQLQQLVDSQNIKSDTIRIEAQWSKDIAPAIKAYCNNHPVSMVIKTGHRSETLLYTSTDWQLLRECPAPVMITARKSWKKKHVILAAVDFATKTKSKIKLNHTIIQQAQALAESLEQKTHLVYALTIPQALVDMDIIDARKFASTKRKELQSTIDAICKEYKIEKDQLHIKIGSPDKVIPSIANKLKSDLVITGTIGRKGVKSKLIGNTVESVLSRLHSDILAIKP